MLWKSGEERREDEGGLNERREGWRRQRTERTIRIDGKIAAESERERERGGAKGSREEMEASHRQHIFDSFYYIFSTY